jgi:hypothetical protein
LSSTTSNYINKINQNYPSPGVDNDSQGFRDNYKNIALALNSANDEITDLQMHSVKLDQTNDFGQHLIKQAQFQDCSVYVFDNTAVNNTGDVTLDYRNGSYQKISLAAGTHNITITNWPGNNKSGALTLAVTTSTTYDTTVNFVDSHVVNLSSDALPVKLPQGSPVIFNINSDGTSGNLFVKKMNDRTLKSTTVDIDSRYVTGTNVVALESLQLGSNIYHTNETTSSYFTVVTNTNTDAIGNVALLPNQAITQFAGVINDPNIGTTSTNFTVADITGIRVGARFIFNSHTITNTYSVISIDGNKIETQEFDAADLSGDPIGSWPDMIFTNPRFPGQPQLLNLIAAEPDTLVGAPGDLRGQVYANSDALYVAVTDFGNNTTNWAKFNSVGSAGATSGATAAVTNDSNTLATTAFVHNILPYGTIIMWHSTSATIPTGWALCDGTNSTPNLVNMFIRGANAATALTSGGTDDAVIVQHNHSASSLVTDPGHFHLVGSDDLRGADPAGDANSREGVYDWPGSPVGNTAITNTVGTGITVATTVDNNGVSGTGKNIPAYYALCYIMKTTGA